MEQMLPRLLNRDLTTAAILHPAQVSLKLEMTPLSTVSLELTELDGEVEVGQFVEIRDLEQLGEQTGGVYRIVSVEKVQGRTGTRRVTGEHALVTLSDRLLFGYCELGGAGMPVCEVIRTLLAGQDLWTLGTCEVETYFSYAFENENVLTALLSLLTPMDRDVGYTFDMTSTPWKLNLVRRSSQAECEVRLKRNLREAEVKWDTTDLVTRLYPLGYGEGVDQLTIASVNGGVPYLDAPTVSEYGIVQAIYTESTMDDASTLLSAARSVLSARQRPALSLRLSALALADLTGEPLDRFVPGTLCRVCLEESGITEDVRILSVEIPDVYGRPREVSLTLSSRWASTEEELSKLQRKSSISELYAQGAASEYSVHFGDNADEDHGAELAFYLDADAIHVNAVRCRFRVKPFRGYTKAASGGGTGSLVVDGCSATVQVPETTITTGYNISGAAEGKHVHNAQTSAQTLNVRILSAALEGALDVGRHSHATLFGIDECPLSSSQVTVYVDGTEVPASAISEGELDAVSWLSRDAAGKILRGAWHTVSFVPSALARIEADVHVRTFVRSLTGAVL